MEQKKCACKGVRSCLICERPDVVEDKTQTTSVSTRHLYQCHNCGSILGEGETDFQAESLPVCVAGRCRERKKVTRARLEASEQDGSLCSALFEGVTVIKEFVSVEEEERIVSEIDASQWAESQSGRRKQDYGPKVNFKRQKVKLGSFDGLPPFSEWLVRRMQRDVEELRDFTSVELCNLDYSPERGSAIDPHMDDGWIWGERLVTLNMLSHTYLTFSPAPLHTPPSCSHNNSTPQTSLQIHVPLPQRSLVIVQGSSRYHWQHSIRREHIHSRRLATTLRELTADFKPGGSFYDSAGREILRTASNFQGTPVNFR